MGCNNRVGGPGGNCTSQDVPGINTSLINGELLKSVISKICGRSVGQKGSFYPCMQLATIT